MANVFFGKMKNAEQCRNLMCSSHDNSYFGDIQEGDYVFIRLRNENPPEGGSGTHTHRLWKYLHTDHNADGAYVAHFEEVFTFNSLKIKDFARLTIFKLNSASVVLTSRQVRKKGFVKLDLADEVLFNRVVNSQQAFNAYLEDNTSYRNIVYLDDISNAQESDKDIQIYKDDQSRFNIFNRSKAFLHGLTFKSDRYDEMRALIDRGLPNRFYKSHRKVVRWLDGERGLNVRLLDLWDLFCSNQPISYNPADPAPSIEEDDEEDVDDEYTQADQPAIVEQPLNIILYGPPGTGKTYKTIVRAVSIVENKSYEEVDREDYEVVFNRFNNYKNNGIIDFITFHQSYGYEDFIEGIKPEIMNDNVVYKVKPGVFKRFCERPIASEQNSKRVFIIDEINRGNIAKIFGELITLIEPSKRLGNKEPMKCVLPYSGDSFGVPNNVYIIGTMNTADRSLVHLDAALRRRFEFEEMMPDYKLLRGLTVGKIEIDKLLKAINDRICVLLDREHQIGHSYFLELKDDNSLALLNQIFRNKIIPLLQEYFYEEYLDIKTVLNDDNDFIIDEPSAYLFNLDDNTERNYRINPLDKFPNREEPYLRIYNKIVDTDAEEEPN